MSTPPNNAKVSRDEWIDAAIAALVSEPIDGLKVLSLADRLGVSRSSFYWYFESREQFLDALIERWQRNTESIVERAGRGAPTVTSAVLGVFECWADTRLFDVVLDQAMRDWGRRHAHARSVVGEADALRLGALASMFMRYGCDNVEATVRARLVYHSQVGLYAVDEPETVQQRLDRLPSYVVAMTGYAASAQELAAFAEFVAQHP
jgi:AcrR family transcriptional regulator